MKFGAICLRFNTQLIDDKICEKSQKRVSERQ